MEFLEQLLFLSFQVLILLQFDLIFPLKVLIRRGSLSNLLLTLIELLFDFFVDFFGLFKLIYFLADLLCWSNNLLIVLLFDKSLLICLIVLCFFKSKVTSQRSDQIEICFSNSCVVFLDVSIFLFVLIFELVNSLIFLGFDFRTLNFAFLIHFFS